MISEEDLKKIGVTSQEIEEAGGVEVVAHIVWFFQQTENYTNTMLDDAIMQAVQKKKQQDIVKQSFDDFYNTKDDNDNGIQNTETDIKYHENNTKNKLENKKFDYSVPDIDINIDNTMTIKQIYEANWGKNPHPALKLLLEAYFIETQDIIPSDLDDKKEILKTINLLRSYVAGKKLPLDAEEEQLIAYAGIMYKEFLTSQEDYQNCPMAFLLDEYYEFLPEKYRILVQSLPVVAILRIFADNCFYDSDTHIIEEALPEEIDIKNLCDMIEKLAIIFKIWQ